MYTIISTYKYTSENSSQNELRNFLYILIAIKNKSKFEIKNSKLTTSFKLILLTQK